MNVTWLQSQFDKLLMAGLFVCLCGLASLLPGNDRLDAFFLQSAAGCLGCLLTLVTQRRNVPPDGAAPLTVQPVVNGQQSPEVVKLDNAVKQ
jgi:hypothetical protein